MKRSVPRQVILWGLARSVYEAALDAWLRGLDRIALDAAVGLIVGSLWGTDVCFPS